MLKNCFPLLQKKLVRLVESYKDKNTDLVKLEQDIVELDKEIDLYAFPAMKDLDNLDESIAAGLEAAFGTLDRTVNSSTTLSIIISLVTIVAVSLVFTLFFTEHRKGS